MRPIQCTLLQSPIKSCPVDSCDEYTKISSKIWIMESALIWKFTLQLTSLFNWDLLISKYILHLHDFLSRVSLPEKCSYSEFFWSAFSAFVLNTEIYSVKVKHPWYEKTCYSINYFLISKTLGVLREKHFFRSTFTQDVVQKLAKKRICKEIIFSFIPNIF